MSERAVIENKVEPPTNARNASKGKARNSASSKRPEPGPGTKENAKAARTQAPTAVQPVEPEDAYLTGVSRSLQRRLLGLNVEGAQGQAKPHPEATAPGLHATGSYTSDEGVKPSKRK